VTSPPEGEKKLGKKQIFSPLGENEKGVLGKR
jgi:hypothetical protein